MGDKNPIIVLTTCSPGLAQVCLAYAKVPVDDAVVLTTPGASIGDVGTVGSTFAVALAMSRARQIRVLAYEDDPIYQMGDRGLKAALQTSGIQPGASGQSQFPVAGLQANARQTVLHTLAELVLLDWIPDGLWVSGHVLQLDGQCVELGRLQTGSRRPPEAAIPQPRSSRPATVAPPPMTSIPGEGLVYEEMGEQDSGEPVFTGPVGGDSASPATSEGPVALGAFGSSGPVARSASGGPLGGGGPMEIVSQIAGGPLEIVSEIDGGPLETGAPEVVGELQEGAADTLLTRLNSWTPRVEVPLEAVAPPPVPEPPREATVQQRLVSATDTLHDFLQERCPHHSMVRDMRRKHSGGTHPDAILDDLLELVRGFAEDDPKVRAAYGTLEMAQSILDREQQLAVLWRVIRG